MAAQRTSLPARLRVYADFENLREGLAEPEFEILSNVVNLGQRPVRIKSAV